MLNFEFIASTVPEIRRGSQNSKIGSRDPLVTPIDLILHFLLKPHVVNLSVKIDTIYTSKRVFPAKDVPFGGLDNI